jgi:hypothetical protein
MGTGIQPKSESCPNSIHPTWCTGGCWFTLQEIIFSPFLLPLSLSLSLGGIVLFIKNHKNISNTNPSHIIQTMNLRFAIVFLFLVAVLGLHGFVLLIKNKI